MKHIFIIDPGHRKDTPGKQGNGLFEYEFNEDVARRLEKKLKPYGEVHFTIETPKHQYSEMNANGRSKNLNARATKANQIYYSAVKKYGKGNFKIVFISIHANAFSSPNASGYEVFVYKHGGQAHKLAKSVHKQAQVVLRVGSDIKDRGIKEANFAVLRSTIMPAILVEHEFYTNPVAAKKLKDPLFRDKCAEHLCKGALNYMGIKEKANVNSGGGKKMLYRVRKTWKDSASQKGAYTDLDNAKELADNIGYNVYDEKGIQVYPKIDKDKTHWAYPHYKNLVDNGMEIHETRFDDNITRGEVFKLLNVAMNKDWIEEGIAGKPVEKPIVKPNKKYEILHPNAQTTIVKIPHELVDEISIEIANTGNKLETIESMQKRTKADFIINGGLFWYDSKKNLAHSLNLLFQNGSQNNAGKYSRFGLHTKKDKTYEFRDYKWSTEIQDIIGGSPKLVVNGKIDIDKDFIDTNLLNARHPRSAIGMSKDYFFLVVIDGRNISAGLKGMSINELAEYMKSLGCDSAINLDGGGSSKVLQGNKVLNKNNTSRSIHNAIGIKLK